MSETPAQGRIAGMAAGIAICLSALAMPAPAPAATTIGSDLSSPSGFTVAGGKTFAATDLPGGQVTSPIDGVIHVWRVREFPGGPLRLRVLRPQAGGLFLAAGSGPTESPTEPMPTYEIGPQGLPVKAGDLIGVDAEGPFAAFANTVGAEGIAWDPVLGEGSSLAPNAGPFPDLELLLNADVEPDRDGDRLGDETRDPDISVTATLPGKRQVKLSKGAGLKKRLPVKVSCGEVCSVKIGAEILAPRRTKGVRSLDTPSATARITGQGTVAIPLGKKALGALRASMAAGKLRKASAVVVVTATDSEGHTDNAERTFRLR